MDNEVQGCVSYGNSNGSVYQGLNLKQFAIIQEISKCDTTCTYKDLVPDITQSMMSFSPFFTMNSWANVASVHFTERLSKDRILSSRLPWFSLSMIVCAALPWKCYCSTVFNKLSFWLSCLQSLTMQLGSFPSIALRRFMVTRSHMRIFSMTLVSPNDKTTKAPQPVSLSEIFDNFCNFKFQSL